MSFHNQFLTSVRCWICLLICSGDLCAPAFADTLTIIHANEGKAVVQWEAKPLAPFATKRILVSYQLQQSSDLRQWEALGDPVLEDNPMHPNKGSLTLTMSEGNRFFRQVKVIVGDDTDFESEDLSIGQFPNMALQNRSFSFSLMDETDFSGADLSGAHLFGADGISARFKQATLAGAELTTSILTNSDFRSASLTGATARFANLSQNDFSGADLRFVDFTGTDLFRSNLKEADIRGAVFTDTDLRLVPLHGAVLDEMTLMPEVPMLAWQIVNEGMPFADLSGLDLTGMVLSGGNLNGARLNGTRMTAVDLRGADIRGADLSDTVFDLMDVRQTIIDANTLLPDTLRIIWGIVNSRQDRLDLRDVDLTDAVLNSGYLREADLRGATLVGAVFIGADLRHANLRNADLRNAALQGADLGFADLTGARLSRNGLSGAHLEETILPDGSVSSPE